MTEDTSASIREGWTINGADFAGAYMVATIVTISLAVLVQSCVFVAYKFGYHPFIIMYLLHLLTYGMFLQIIFGISICMPVAWIPFMIILMLSRQFGNRQLASYIMSRIFSAMSIASVNFFVNLVALYRLSIGWSGYPDKNEYLVSTAAAVVICGPLYGLMLYALSGRRK